MSLPPEMLPQLVTLLAKVNPGKERDAVEKTITRVAGRIADLQQRTAPLVARLEVADEVEACILLPVLGRIGGDAAHAAITKARKSPQAEVREVALRALCNWPDASVAPELWAVVTSTASEEARLPALRAYIRVVSLPSDRPAPETLKLLQSAWDKASRADEKKLILSRAASARCLETLRWVAPPAGQPRAGSRGQSGGRGAGAPSRADGSQSNRIPGRLEEGDRGL